MSLILEFNHKRLVFDNVDKDNEMPISIEIDEEEIFFYINHQDASEIIKHLKQQFES